MEFLTSGSRKHPKIVSMSYGTPELDNCYRPNDCQGLNSTQYQELVDLQWVKIGMLGVSLIAASGDYGTSGNLPAAAQPRVIPFQAGSAATLTCPARRGLL